MQIKNPYLKKLHESIRKKDKQQEFELTQKSREFVEDQLNELKLELKHKVKVLTDFEKELNFKNDRKRIREIISQTTQYKRRCKELDKKFLSLNRDCRLILKTGNKSKD